MNRVRELRERLGWKQELLARKVGISISYLSMIENGNRGKRIQYELALKIANALGVTAGEVFGHYFGATDQKGRLLFHPELHPNQDEDFTTEELAYLCKFADVDSLKLMSHALGRTEQKIQNKLNHLRKSGTFDYYKSKWDLLGKKITV